jgi:hypothetical protein
LPVVLFYVNDEKMGSLLRVREKDFFGYLQGKRYQTCITEYYEPFAKITDMKHL